MLKNFQKTKNKNIKASILISGPYKDERKGKVAKILKSFFVGKWDWEKIKKVCKNFVVIHGSNDQMVNFSHAEYISEKLNGELIKIEKGGHLNGSASFYTLPECLDAICKITKK